MTYPLFDWRPGDQVWGISFDAAGSGWIVGQVGKVIGVGRGMIRVRTPKGEALIARTAGPMFPSQEHAQRWANENPPKVPRAPGV